MLGTASASVLRRLIRPDAEAGAGLHDLHIMQQVYHPTSCRRRRVQAGSHCGASMPSRSHYSKIVHVPICASCETPRDLADSIATLAYM